MKSQESLRSSSADSDADVGETDDEDTDSPQSNSAEDNAQTENLNPATKKEKKVHMHVLEVQSCRSCYLVGALFS